MTHIENKGLGYVPDLKDDRDFLWRAAVAPELCRYPTSFRHRRVGPVLDQKSEGSCVGHAAAAVKQWQECVEHRRFYDFDAKELYARCKDVDGYAGSGTYSQSASFRHDFQSDLWIGS